MKKMEIIYACEEHIELALDVVVDETEKPPIVNKLSDEKQLSTMCTYCKRNAMYEVTA